MGSRLFLRVRLRLTQRHSVHRQQGAQRVHVAGVVLQLRDAVLHVPAFLPQRQAAGKQAGTGEGQAVELELAQQGRARAGGGPAEQAQLAGRLPASRGQKEDAFEFFPLERAQILDEGGKPYGIRRGRAARGAHLAPQLLERRALALGASCWLHAGLSERKGVD